MTRREFARLATMAASFAPLVGADGETRHHTSSPAAKPVARIECVAGCGQGTFGGPAREARLVEP
ncbi:MAG TPA: hypothetical protein VFD58_27195 [Blastocatellia bacterium]|nr:hypothetical protein [Blastocatellia bacterium]